jgi:cytochrome c peroxidase
MKRNQKSSLMPFGILVISLFFLASCKQEIAGRGPTSDPGNSPIPKSPGTIAVPADNPMTAAKIELGRHLFFDKSLSVDGSTSCGSCHDPNIGFADSRGLATSIGFQGRQGNRNAPSLANVAFNTAFTWDGRFKSLEEHAPGPIFNSLEMGNNFSTGRNPADTIPSGYHSDPGNNDTLFLFRRLNDHTDPQGKTYADLFIAAWGNSDITMDRIAKSIATFERTFISKESVFDKYNNGDQNAYRFNAEALHGFQLFTGKAGCISCHSGYNFTDQKFHNNGIGPAVSKIFDTSGGNNSGADLGRFSVTKNTSDKYLFKTPSLRNVAMSAPYMHDGGRFSTLYDVIANYNAGGNKATENQDPNIKPLNLSDGDIADIIAFLETLNDAHFASNPIYDNPWIQ